MKLTPEQEAARASWQYRCIDKLRGNQTLAGCILTAALGRVASNPPTVGMTGWIDKAGRVRSHYVTKARDVLPDAYLGITAQEMAEGYRRLADHLKLNDGERVELFDTIRKWVAKDERAESNLEASHEG